MPANKDRCLLKTAVNFSGLSRAGAIRRILPFGNNTFQAAGARAPVKFFSVSRHMIAEADGGGFRLLFEQSGEKLLARFQRDCSQIVTVEKKKIEDVIDESIGLAPAECFLQRLKVTRAVRF